MGKKKAQKPEADQPQQEAKSEYVHVIHRFDKVLGFPAGWDQGKLSDARISEIREYLRGNKGAEQIETEVHTSQNRITDNKRTRQTALFFVQTTSGGELVPAGGNPIQARKGNLVLLPAGQDFIIKASYQNREIIEFTF